VSGSETITFGRVQATATGSGDLTDELIGTDVWTDELVAGAGIPMVDVPLVSVGGGIGSFVLSDYLRCAGVSTDQIRVLTVLDTPYETYRFLCNNSQIPEHERLRSDSGSTPDNIWGFPAYAIREAFASRSLKGFVDPLWNVFTEPIIRDYYTPRSGQVFRALDREAARISWQSMLAKGQVRMVRRRAGGGYFTILTPPEGTTRTKRVAYRSRWTHIAVGYPALRFLPDLQAYRETYKDYTRVVNAYEPHEHVYEELRRRQGVVIVRGSGIVASRILQRLVDDRDRHGAQTLILHLFRSYVDGPQGRSVFFRRPGGAGWAYQGFNVAKASWGGQLKEKLIKLEGQERADLTKEVGGTNTPRRKLWIEQLTRGAREGWYRQHVGQVTDVRPDPSNPAAITSSVKAKDGSVSTISSNYIIDCTGLEGGPRDHRLLADLLDHGGAGLNPTGRLDCERNFEVRGTASAPGKLYASGSATAGAYYAGVDSFLGLQYVALQVTDDLARQGFGNRLGAGRSVAQWTRWVRNHAP